MRLLPVAMDGAFQAWPKGSWLPRFTRICVHIAAPIEPDETAAMSDDELVADLERRIRECHRLAREHRLS